jgi:hypothetical protein
MYNFYKLQGEEILVPVEPTRDFTGYMIEWQISELYGINIPYIFMQIKDGLAEGWCAHYYNNGIMACLLQFHKGKRHGIQKRWYEKGQPFNESTYIHNQKHGRYRMWSEAGHLILNTQYSFGKQFFD